MRVYPKSGKKDDLFDRLKEYIDQYEVEKIYYSELFANFAQRLRGYKVMRTLRF